MNEFMKTHYHAREDTEIRVTEWPGQDDNDLFFTVSLGGVMADVTIYATPHFLSRLAETLSKYRGVEEQLALRGIVEEEREGESACP